MGTNNGNGTQRPKLELEVGQEVQLKLIKDKCYQGKNSVGPYFLYSVQDLDDGEEKAFFAPEDIHRVITDLKLGKDSVFNLKRVKNGKPGSSKLELSLVNTQSIPSKGDPISDNLKQLLLQSIRDAVEIVKEAGIQFSNDELQKLATTLFIQRSR